MPFIVRWPKVVPAGKVDRAAVITAVFAGVASFVLLKITGVIVDLRVDQNDESQGLDLALHDEVGYNL